MYKDLQYHLLLREGSTCLESMHEIGAAKTCVGCLFFRWSPAILLKMWKPKSRTRRVSSQALTCPPVIYDRQLAVWQDGQAAAVHVKRRAKILSTKRKYMYAWPKSYGFRLPSILLLLLTSKTEQQVCFPCLPSPHWGFALLCALAVYTIA